MKKSKREKLEAAGWKVGSAADFLGLSQEEEALINAKLMLTATLEDVQAHLAAWIAKLQPGEELLITQDGQLVARLIAEPKGVGKARRPGSAIGQLKIAEEDDAHLEDFREHMP